MTLPPTPRVPPRFVPTLTEVVKDSSVVGTEQVVPAKTSEHGSAPISSAALPSKAQRLAPSVATAPQPDTRAPSGIGIGPRAQVAPAATHSEVARPILSKDFEELLVHRVMQRVDVSLDIRLRGAIAAVVEEQTRSIVPRLREEIEAVVRQAVYEAVADELAAGGDDAAV